MMRNSTASRYGAPGAKRGGAQENLGMLESSVGFQSINSIYSSTMSKTKQ